MSQEQGTELPTTSTPTLSINRSACIATEFDSKDQLLFICRNNPKLFPILKFAEQVARKACEEDFKQEKWNCSHFSLLKQPNITKTGDLGCCIEAKLGGCRNSCAIRVPALPIHLNPCTRKWFTPYFLTFLYVIFLLTQNPLILDLLNTGAATDLWSSAYWFNLH